MDYNILCHTTWDCKYHVVFIPLRRRKVLYGALRTKLGEIFHELARRRGCKIIEGHICVDHVHMCILIPPKEKVSDVIGYIKGKSAIAIAKIHGKNRNFTGERFWARGYFVSTIGRDEEKIRQYIRNQEKQEQSLIEGRLV